MKIKHAVVRFFHTFFVLALMLGSVVIAPAPAQAQAVGNNVYLPFLMGIPAELDIPVRGPTREEVQALLAAAPAPEETQKREPAPEIRAAGSCYSDGGFYTNFTPMGFWGISSTPVIQVATNGSHCGDLNINTWTLSPMEGCWRYLVNIWDANGNPRSSGVNVVCRYPQQWKVLAHGLNDGDSYQILIAVEMNKYNVLLAD